MIIFDFYQLLNIYFLFINKFVKYYIKLNVQNSRLTFTYLNNVGLSS